MKWTACILALAWFAGLHAAAQPVAAPPAVPTIEDFTAPTSTMLVALSPGGRHVASVRLQGDDAFLTVRDIRSPDATPVASRLGKVLVYGLRWVSDDRLVYSAGSTELGVSYRRGQLHFTGVPQLFSTTRDLKDHVALFRDDRKITRENIIGTAQISRIPGDADHFLVPVRISGDLDLIRVNARDGTWTLVAEGLDLTAAWFVDRTGQPAIRFDSNRRGTEIRVMTPERRENGSIRWRLATRVRFNVEKDRAEEFLPVAPGADPKHYYVLARPNGADRIGVHLYNVETQTFTQEVFGHPKVDVDGALVDPATGEYLGASYWEDMLGVTFADRRMQAHFNGLHEFFGRERNIFFVQSSDDRQVWIIGTSGPRDPGSFHVYDMANARSELIGYSNLRLKPEQLGRSQPVSWKARDGMEIPGYLTLPPGLAEGARLPLIVLAHGGPEARDQMDYDVTVQFLATRGYAVLQPNFRGSSGFGKAFAEAGRRQFGKAMQTDIADGVRMLIDKGLVDADRICIMGASYGGFATLMNLIQFPELYRCGASAAGVMDFVKQLRWERETEGSDSESYKYWVAQVGDPNRDRQELEAISPINNIAAIKAPVLLLHGTQDYIVPFEQSELMHAALKKAGKQSLIVQFQGAGHDFSDGNLDAYLQQLEKFFAQHLAAPPG